MLSKIKGWLTPDRRKVIYTTGASLGAALLTLAVALGIVTPEMIDKVLAALGVVSGAILTFTNILARVNVSQGDV